MQNGKISFLKMQDLL